jgi:hypothetical protein
VEFKMWRFLKIALLASAVLGSSLPSHLGKREEACSDLTISENKGDRKVAIVVDSSQSMRSNDPRLIRLSAARALNTFLVANGEGDKPDQVTVVNFAGTAYLQYAIGDPNGATAAISNITNNDAGTFIGRFSLVGDEWRCVILTTRQHPA